MMTITKVWKPPGLHLSPYEIQYLKMVQNAQGKMDVVKITIGITTYDQRRRQCTKQKHGYIRARPQAIRKEHEWLKHYVFSQALPTTGT